MFDLKRKTLKTTDKSKIIYHSKIILACQKSLLTNHNRSSLSLKMVQQIPPFGWHFCSCADKHNLWGDSQKMFQAHTDFKWAYPLPRADKLFTFVLEVNKRLLNFSVAWDSFWCVALVSKPGSNGLKWSVCTTPTLDETKWIVIYRKWGGFH